MHPVVLICRSGKRSLEAGKLLIDNGFVDVYNVDEGFEGELDAEAPSQYTGWLALPRLAMGAVLAGTFIDH